MNLFVVETLLQTINAIEARRYFNENNNILIVLYSVPFPKDAFLPLINQDDWASITFFEISNRIYRVEQQEKRAWIIEIIKEHCNTFRQFQRRAALDNIMKAYQEVDTLFLGNYLIGHMRHFANKIKYKKLVALDDGTDTLRINELRITNITNISNKQKVSIWKTFKGYMRQRYIEWDSSEASSIIFFSTYDLNVRKGDILIKNNFLYLKSQLQSQQVNDEVYFLGQPLVEDGYITNKCFYRYLSGIKFYFKNQKIVYLPHKRESEESVSQICENFDFQVRKFKVPIEINLLNAKQRPIILASFFSSALDNCRLIFGDILTIKVFYIREDDLNNGYDFVRDTYNYLEKKTCQTFDVVKLEIDSKCKKPMDK